MVRPGNIWQLIFFLDLVQTKNIEHKNEMKKKRLTEKI